MMTLIYILLFGFGIIGFIIAFLKKIKKDISKSEIIMVFAYILSLVLMLIGFSIHDNQYYIAVDPIADECYIPFGDQHIITLIFYFIAFNASILLIWLKNGNLPPLTKVLSLSFFIIGIIINFCVLLQISEHNTESLTYGYSRHFYFFIFAPILSIIISTFLLLDIVENEMMNANEMVYSNKFLNKLNAFLAQKSNLSTWSIILIIPILLVVTVILILFGQDSDSLIKAFTETTTWRFSQKMHPPILDHNGHYLCTIAVAGNPKIVKPIRFGKRHGKIIIVNRQLLIANAFEEMIENISPKIHQLIRKNYDKYGYNLSKKINTEKMSNLTYILMKPLEWIFLISLYLICEKPEERINKQYRI